MSTYKAEVLYQSYRGKLRPMAHYVLGFLPQLARLSTPMAPVVNRISRLPGFGQLAKQIGGIDARRSIPQFKIGRAPSELQSRGHLVCRLLLEKKKQHDH